MDKIFSVAESFWRPVVISREVEDNKIEAKKMLDKNKKE